MTEQVLRIGGASGFWGDAARATGQLLGCDELDYIVYDYLAEITMSIMARARAKDDNKGFATDFVSAAMKPNLAQIASRGIKVVSNAGGVNPEACVAALQAEIEAQGLDLKVACVTGDDLLERKAQFAANGAVEMFTGEDFPDPQKILSINAYLGAFPIAAALRLGADIVVTGRCVDSAVTLGACIHAFGWQRDDYDRLAMGSLAGHILECGPQATGGNFTDWEDVPRLSEIGYPVAEISADGSFVCTKPTGSGGLVTVGSVAEQMLYEIGDPQAYILPDVVCDFSTAQLQQVGEDRVHVTGARGSAAPDSYKVSATFADQFRGGTYMTFYGIDADKKAEALGEAVFEAARSTLAAVGLPDFSETSIEVLGTESQYGNFSEVESSREVVMKLAAKHPEMVGIGIMLKEAVGLGLATPPGLSGFAGSRPSPSPVVRLFSYTVPRSEVAVTIHLAGQTHACDEVHGEARDAAQPERPAAPVAAHDDDMVEVPLVKLAWGRSGDKGNKANVGIIARQPHYLPYIWAALSEAVVTDRFAHFLDSTGAGCVERFLLPGSHAINFLLHDVLGGGGVASIRNDPQGKGYAQLLLSCPINVPAALAETLS
ncbi:MAG: acyclic terpene utilization AtuA family protein [Halioglobus sp.]|nr:acyclic terpene utilization AtuA family protein [Halioglobus sp.]